MDIRKISLIKIAAISFLLTIIWSASAYAQPDITSFSGSLTDGGTLTITGSGFGTKAQPAPHKWDDFDNGINDTVIGNGWVLSTGADSGLTIKPKYSNENARYTGSLAAKMNFTDNPTQYNCAIGLDETITKYYVSAWRYITTSGAPSRNVKTIRIYGSNNLYPMTGHTHFPVYKSNIIFALGENGSGLEKYYAPYDFNTGVWERVEYYWEQSDPNVANGKYYHWKNGTLIQSIVNEVFRGSTSGYWNELRIGHYFSRDTYTPTPSAYEWFDDVYIDTTQARVEIGNAPTWAASTHREIQIPSVWSGTSITITLNQGSFANFNNNYLYVIDADGNVNENGYLLSDGGDTPPPSGGGSGGDTSASGGSGCGFVKDDGKGQGTKGEGLSFILMLIITLTAIAIARRFSNRFSYNP